MSNSDFIIRSPIVPPCAATRVGQDREVILVSTWEDGVFVFGDEGVAHELAGQQVRHLTLAGGAPLAVLGTGALSRRVNGAWTRWAELPDAQVSCCVAVGANVFAGTDDARMLRVDRDGRVETLAGFGDVPGRERWFAGGMVVDGTYRGPPLGVRSITATCDGAALLANVHVGGIPRSADGGRTWRPTIDVDADVHEVRAHPTRPELVAAATAIGLAISRDAGATWTIEAGGLHAPHCAAVTFVGDDILVSAAADPFADDAAVYRRHGEGLVQVTGGLPRWTHGLVDTHALAARGASVALADKRGYLYLSRDRGHTWTCVHERLPFPSSVVLLGDDA
jgi:hypothetical protein